MIISDKTNASAVVMFCRWAGAEIMGAAAVSSGPAFLIGGASFLIGGRTRLTYP